MKKFLWIGLSIVVLWFLYIWVQYHFLYKSYSQEEINSIFKKENLEPPVYDSIFLRGYQIYYLTNKLNRNVELDPNTNKRKPYLVLLHDGGKSSNYFLDYFKNKNTNSRYHIIAIDRLGFGKSHFIKPESEQYIFPPDKVEYGEHAEYVNSIAPKEILGQEGQHLEETRIVSDGKTAYVGLRAYNSNYLSFVKTFLFYPDLDKRSSIAKFFSKTVAMQPISYLFPRAFVNKHRDLIMLDEPKDRADDNTLGNAKYSEDQANEGYNNLNMKTVFFITDNEKEKQKIRKDIGNDKNFIIDVEKKESIYTNPSFVNDIIMKNDVYNFDFNRIK
ncbi:hypothetical protein [Soonwooa sp.]|uniref:hypothetical protein n=1 Tax=Soonwooa sp. TaxID=1938592 RepID=UPI00260F67C0|nr:hypothetical protein [Soonwooa sp.]